MCSEVQIHLAPFKLLYVHLYVHKQPQKVSHISMDVTMEEATLLLDNDINSPRDQRNYPKKPISSWILFGIGSMFDLHMDTILRQDFRSRFH